MRSATRSCLFFVAAATLVLASSPMAIAGQIFESESKTLSYLLETGGSIEVGDKLFDDFRFVQLDGNEVSADDIIVTAFFDEDTMEAELRFVSGILTASSTGSFGPPIQDFAVSFDVTITDPNYVFDYVALSGTTSVEGTGLVKVAESITEFNVGDLSVINRKEGDVQINFRDFERIDVPEGLVLSKLDNVTKDVLVRVGSGGDIEDLATLTTFSQFYGQRLIPEPAAIGLICMAAVGMFGRRK